MKNYLINGLTIFIFLMISTFLTAQNQDFKIKEGGYIFEEFGGYGIPALFTLGYEKVKIINDNRFLSTKIGVNSGVWITGYNVGVPHGVSMNFGKKHVFLETGVNGWFGYFQDDENLSDIQNGFIYTVGTNIGVNTAFHLLRTDWMFRTYLNPMYNVNSELIRKVLIWGGIGMSVRIHK